NNDMLLQWLATDPGAGQSEAEGELRHAIHLAGELKVAGALPVLLTRLRPEHPLVDQVIDALGNVGDIKASEPLVKLATPPTNSDNRRLGTLSQFPVEEEDAVGSRRYWTILRALGNLPPTEAAVSLLLEATGDFAPDKRQQAFESLVASLQMGTTSDIRQPVKSALREALQDPSVPVRMAALDGI